MQNQLPRRTLLRYLVAFSAAGAPEAGELELRLNGDGLRVSAPRLRFLQGKALERLRDGAAVTANLQYSILVDARSTVFRRTVGSFVVSFDLWEEKFAVARLLPTRLSASHLSMSAAEGWCMDNLPIPVDGLAPTRDFWLKLELRLDDSRSQPAISGDPGISLNALIEIFSRSARVQQPRWQLDGGPFRLANLRK